MKPDNPRPSRGRAGPKKSRDLAPMTQIGTEAAGAQLNKAVQRRLGDTLRAMYDEVLNEGVPSRFTELLKRIDEKMEPHNSEALSSVGGPQEKQHDLDATSQGMASKFDPDSGGETSEKPADKGLSNG